MKRRFLLIALVAIMIFAFGLHAAQAALSGAIHTTDVKGVPVNQNLYEDKMDVYLEGGPAPNAPLHAAALPPGDYYYMVTDPSGKVLLSEKAVEDRKFHVGDDGRIDQVYDWATPYKYKGTNYSALVGADDDGGVTCGLWPFRDTPNKGGVYKVWVTPVAAYSSGNGFHGFIPSMSKTVNFKVKTKKTPPYVTGKKFHDANVNGTKDEGEDWVTGWEVTVDEPGDLPLYSVYTDFGVWAGTSGTWSFTEATPDDTLQTVAIRDGVVVSQYPNAEPNIPVTIVGTDCETHEVVWGNVGLSSLKVTKYFDSNGDGMHEGLPLPGWRFMLTGTDVTGASVGPVYGETDANGEYVFNGLLPGTYTVSEVMPNEGNWVGQEPQWFTLESHLDADGIIHGDYYEMWFANSCWREASFYTKGGWSGVSDGQKGLDVISGDDTTFFNGLAMFADNPLDGYNPDGTPVPAVTGTKGEQVAPEGSVLAEYNQVLLDSVAGDRRTALKSQFVAFALNCRHQEAFSVMLPDGSWGDFGTLTWLADSAWTGNDPEVMDPLTALFDQLNSSGTVKVLCSTPCPYTYD